MAKSSTPREAFTITASGYAAGYLPIPLAVSVILLVHANNASTTGSVSVLWVLIASIPAALILGPLNTRRTLAACGDPLANDTAKAAVLMGAAGLVLQALILVPLLYLGWIGLVIDVAVTALTVPALARQRVLSKVEEARMADRVRIRGGVS